MIIKSRIFGEIDIDESKVITFADGLMGFETYKKFAILHDSEKEHATISWLQSVEEPELAFAVMDPMAILSEYNPVVEDELLASLGETESDADYYLLTVVTVPKDIKNMTVNLKAPLVINTKTMKGMQIIVSNEDYAVKYNVFDCIKKLKEGK